MFGRKEGDRTTLENFCNGLGDRTYPIQYSHCGDRKYRQPKGGRGKGDRGDRKYTRIAAALAFLGNIVIGQMEWG